MFHNFAVSLLLTRIAAETYLVEIKPEPFCQPVSFLDTRILDTSTLPVGIEN